MNFEVGQWIVWRVKKLIMNRELLRRPTRPIPALSTEDGQYACLEVDLRKEKNHLVQDARRKRVQSWSHEADLHESHNDPSQGHKSPNPRVRGLLVEEGTSGREWALNRDPGPGLPPAKRNRARAKTGHPRADQGTPFPRGRHLRTMTGDGGTILVEEGTRIRRRCPRRHPR